MRTLLIVSELFVSEAKTVFPNFVTCSLRLLPPKNASVPDAYKFFKGFSEVIIITLPEEKPWEESVKKLAIKAAFAGEIIASTCESISDFGCHLLEPSNAKNFRVLLNPQEIVEPRESWPALKTENQNTVKKSFPLEALPKPMQEYCNTISESTGTKVEFAGLAILGAMAGAIGGSSKLLIKDGWEEFAVLWLAICSDPGTTKSPVLKSCFKPIRGIQSELRKQYQMGLTNFNEAKEKARKDRESAIPIKPEPKYVYLVDATTEGLVTALANNPRGGCLVSDELTSWLGSFDKYTGKGNDKPFYLSLWSSSPYYCNRKAGTNLAIELPILSVIGGVTPSSLPKLHGGQEDGFLARILIACPENTKSYFNRIGISETDQLAYDSFIRKLYAIEPDHIDNESISPKKVVLSEDALSVFESFYNAIEDEKKR